MNVPDVKDDEAVAEWIWSVFGVRRMNDLCALRSLVREVARKVVRAHMVGQTIDESLDSVCGPATGGEGR